MRFSGMVSLGLLSAWRCDSALAEPAHASDEAPHITYEAGIGAGLLREHELSIPSGTSPAIALGGGVGAYVGRSFAVVGRFTTLQGGHTPDERDLTVANEFFLGADVRYWATDRISFAAGGGFGLFDKGPGHGVYALDVRVVYSTAAAYTLTLEATPAFQPETEAQTQRDMWSLYLLLGFERGKR